MFIQELRRCVIDCDSQSPNQLQDVIQYINFQKNTYTRSKVYSDNNIDIFILSWYPDSKSPIHNHPKNGCILKVLFGKLQEHRYLNNKKYIIIGASKNNQSYIDDTIGTHQIIALLPTVSLHIYSPSGFYD
jgi:hypothetical protein